MSEPIYTGERLRVAEAVDADQVPFKPGQLIIQDNGDLYYDGTQYEASDEGRQRVGGGGDTTYTNSAPTSIEVGGIEAGTTFDNTPITDIITKMLYPHIDATLSNVAVNFTPTGAIEKGTTVTYKNIQYTITKGSANITSVVIRDTTSSTDVHTASDSQLATLNFQLNTYGVCPSSFDFSDYSSNEANSHSYSITLKDADGSTVTKTGVVGKPTWVYPYYYGVLPATAVGTADELNTLTKLIQAKGSKQVSFTGDNIKTAFATPASNGKIKKIVDQNNYDVTSAYSEYTVSIKANDGTTQSYYLYIASSASSVNGYKVTFSH